MVKPVLITNLDGLLIRHEAFVEPHKSWFDKVVGLTGDVSFNDWKGKSDYFKGVDLAMKRIMPCASDEEKTAQAREWFQQGVVEYIKAHPEVVYLDAVNALKKLRPHYRLVLLTTNTEEHIEEILKAAGLVGLYDEVFATKANERPDKSLLFADYLQSHEKPALYLAARSKEAFEECINLGIVTVYATWGGADEKISVLADKTIKTPDGLAYL